MYFVTLEAIYRMNNWNSASSRAPEKGVAPPSNPWLSTCIGVGRWQSVPEMGELMMPAAPLKMQRRPKAEVSLLKPSRSTIMIEVRAMKAAKVKKNSLVSLSLSMGLASSKFNPL